jgi:hypothetical protein
MARVVTYECTECGTEVVVHETLGSQVSPIYCCGIAVAEVSPAKKRMAKPVKKAVKKGTKKVIKMKKPVAKKKSPKKS